MDIRRRMLFKKKASSGGGGDDVIPEPIINIDNYLTIEALEDGLTANLSTNACEYCVDGDGNWKTLAAGTATESVNSGHTLSFRGNLIPNSSKGIGTFTINKKCNLKGNCMSMLFGDNAADNYSLSGKNYAFYKLFQNCINIINVSSNFLSANNLATNCYYQMFSGCTKLTVAPELPATTLANYCYSYMFQNCTSLTTAPELPANNLATQCYNGMFQGCTGLTTVYELPATKLTTKCYYQMFYNCTSLTTAPELPATTLANYCYQYMFQNCTSLTTAPALPATTLANYCYYYMFYDCTGLTSAPELPATTLANYCYSYMFRGCTSLTDVPELPATKLTTNCYYQMFSGCTKLTVAPELPATTLVAGCYRDMFYGCTSLTTAPALPATKLTTNCYRGMFQKCTNLNYIKMLATDISASNCLNNWVYKVASTGTFVKNPAMNSLPTGTSGIPSGWTVVNDGEESGGGINITLTPNETTTDNRIAYEYMEVHSVADQYGNLDWYATEQDNIVITGTFDGITLTNNRVTSSFSDRISTTAFELYWEEKGSFHYAFLYPDGKLFMEDDS